VKKLLGRLLRKVFGTKKPGRVKRFTAEVDEMANVRLTWQLPNVSPRQRPLAYTQIETRVSDTLPWTSVAEVEAPAEELLIEDSAPGDWFFRAYAVDDRGNTGAEVFAQVGVDFDAPGAVTGFTAVVE
jgi:hypothetical protein